MSDHQSNHDGRDEWILEIVGDLRSKKEAQSSEETPTPNRRGSSYIYQLPDSVTKVNRNAYTPQVVSFGPFHQGESEKLRAMEGHKTRALFHFVENSRSKIPLDDYVAKFCDKVEELMGAYIPLEEKWHSNKSEFLKLMMLDGCFMLEILRVFTRRIESYSHNDPIFSGHGIVYAMPDIKRDMLMIENQLPLRVLYTLVELGQVNVQPRSHPSDQGSEISVEDYIHEMLCQFYFPDYYPEFGGTFLHVLDFCRWISLFYQKATWADKAIRSKNRAQGEISTIPSATEIADAGIQIHRSSSQSLKNIKFHRNLFGVTLRLPPITVDIATETMLLNFLAFERFHVGTDRDVTNYLVFMNNIIRDTKDVSLLRSRRIIRNALGKDEDVADLFNSVSKDYTIGPYADVAEVTWKVIKYCNKPWVRWRANVVRTYFSSPWAGISVFASMLLFAFTLVQTGYSVFAYYKSP